MKGLNYDADNTLSKVDIEELGLDPAPDGEVSEEETDQINSGDANDEQRKLETYRSLSRNH